MYICINNVYMIRNKKEYFIKQCINHTNKSNRTFQVVYPVFETILFGFNK